MAEKFSFGKVSSQCQVRRAKMFKFLETCYFCELGHLE